MLSLEHERRVAAEEAVRMRDGFMAIASHELRTPLTVIKSTTQLLLRSFDSGLVEPARVIKDLQTLNKTTDQLSMLVADMLDVSRLRTGRLPLRPENLDLSRLAQQVLSEHYALPISEHSIKLHVSGTLPLPLLSADPSRIGQVFDNLIGNAIKYSPAGGEIDISLREQDLGVWVTVSDHGIGLPKGTALNIFEPFGRARNAQASQLHGMGLGLYIARQIVEQHGGRIWADSAGEGLGTHLNFWLPGIALPTTRQRPSRVLVIDDEAEIRNILGDLFELKGYECRLAADGHEALSVLSAWSPDLIVLDLMMPIMDGWTFRHEQLAATIGRYVPIIIISAGLKQDPRDAELAPDAFLTKPFETDELVNTVQHILMREPPSYPVAA
jgi:CheY-like chemotaxis protein